MKCALNLAGEAACFTTSAQEFLGGRYALPRDAAMTIGWVVCALCSQHMHAHRRKFLLQYATSHGIQDVPMA
jgi:hypothetical protein